MKREPASPGLTVWKSEPNRHWDFGTQDGRFFVEVMERLRGNRDLAAVMFRMAKLVDENPGIERAFLMLVNPGMSLDRQNQEWGAGLEILRPGIAGKLALVRLDETGTQIVPSDPAIRRTIETLLPRIDRRPAPAGRNKPVGPARSFFDVLKPLVGSWLSREGPLAISDLALRSDLSYPSVADAIRRLEDRNEVSRTSSRSVELNEFPATSWSELLASADSYRRTVRFTDASGRAPEPDFLHRLLSQRPIPGVAVGGVLAATKLDAGFDFVGIPRLDLELAGKGSPTPSEVARSLDPALVPASRDSTVALAIHHARQTQKLRTEPGEPFPFADPVETLLDLYDLRLIDQAERLIRVLRSGRSTEQTLGSHNRVRGK